MRNLILFLTLLCLGGNGHLQALAAQEDSQSAQRVEATLFFNQVLQHTRNPVIASLIQESLSKLKAPCPLSPAQHQVEVPFLTYNQNGLAVPVLINDQVAATFLLDTGASYTIISTRLARKLDIRVTSQTPRIAIKTANGPISIPLVRLASINLGGVELKNVEVAIHNLDQDMLLSGLLGMNLFKGMDITIKPDRLILHVSQQQALPVDSAGVSSAYKDEAK